MSANRHRGEIAAVIDDQPRRLCLTLGALAELEGALGAGDLGALAARFASGRLAVRDIQLIIACGLRGGGEAVTDAQVAAMTFSGGLHGAVRIAADLVAITFGTGVSEDSPNPPEPQDP